MHSHRSMPRPRPRSRPFHKPQFIPIWGWWTIGSFVGLLFFFFMAAGGIFPRLGHAFTAAGEGLLRMGGPLVLVLLQILFIAVLAGIYLIPAMIASKTPRAAAIFVANLVFGWTGIGWIIIFIWALAESGSINKKPVA